MVDSAQYYGFYSHPALAASYMCFNFVIGVTGMIVPWQAWFNERKYKSWRIAFFVSLAASAVAPIAHRAGIYGLMETLLFYSASPLVRFGAVDPQLTVRSCRPSRPFRNRIPHRPLLLCESGEPFPRPQGRRSDILTLVLRSSRNAVLPATGTSVHRISSGISVRARNPSPPSRSSLTSLPRSYRRRSLAPLEGHVRLVRLGRGLPRSSLAFGRLLSQRCTRFLCPHRVVLDYSLPFKIAL